MSRNLKTFALAVLLITFFGLIQINQTPLFSDEAYYCHISEQFSQSSFFYNWNLAVNQFFVAPLVLIVQGFSLKITPSQVSPIAACRSVSVFAGAISAFAIYLLMKELTKNRFTQLAAGFFVLLNPFSFFANRTSLQEPTMVAFVSLTTYLLVKSKRNFRLFIAALITFGLAFLSKITALIALPGMLWLSFRSAGNQVWQKQIPKTLLLIVTVTIMFFWSYQYTNLWDVVGYHTNKDVNLAQVTKRFWTNMHLSKSWYQQYLTPLFFVSALLGSWQLFKKKQYQWLFFLASIIILSAISVDSYFPRFLLITLPFWAIIIGFSTKYRIGKLVLALMLVVYAINDWKIVYSPAAAKLASEDYFQFYQDWTSGKGVRSALGFVSLNSTPIFLLVPADLSYSFRLQQKSYYPDAEIEFIVISDRETLSSLAKTDDSSNMLIAITSHHNWLRQLAESEFNLEQIYSTHDQTSKSVHLFKLKPKIQY